MALITCSECGAQISSSAKKCIKCGSPTEIQQTQGGNAVTTPTPKKEKSKLILPLSIGGGILLLLIIGGGFLIINQGPSKAELEAKEKATKDSLATVQAMIQSEMIRRVQDSIRVTDSIAAAAEYAAVEDGSQRYSKSQQYSTNNDATSYSQADTFSTNEVGKEGLENRIRLLKENTRQNKAQLTVEYDRLSKIKEFRFGRLPSDRDAQIRDQSMRIQEFEDAISQAENEIQQIENTLGYTVY